MKHYHAKLLKGYDQAKPFWYVLITNQEGRTIDRRPYDLNSRKEAEEYVKFLNGNKAHEE
jgi:hypothetical protein